MKQEFLDLLFRVYRGLRMLIWHTTNSRYDGHMGLSLGIYCSSTVRQNIIVDTLLFLDFGGYLGYLTYYNISESLRIDLNSFSHSLEN